MEKIDGEIKGVKFLCFRASVANHLTEGEKSTFHLQIKISVNLCNLWQKNSSSYVSLPLEILF